jgi:hypothetical protein
MQASVYRLRAAGVPLPRPAEPVLGSLRLAREQHGEEGMLIARLRGGPGHEVLPPLLKAEVRAVTENGLVIRGMEAITRGRQKSRVRFAAQTWWVFILTEGGVATFESLDPLESLADARMRKSLGEGQSF